MIKFAADIPGEDTMLLGLGICEENLNLLMRNRPICFHGEDVRTPGHDYAIFAGNNWDQLAVRMKPLIEGIYPETKRPDSTREISVINICNGSLYVLPMPWVNRPRTVYALGLSAKSCDMLRRGEKLSFRYTPIVEDKRLKATQIVIFWCRDQNELESDFIREGLINGHTEWIKDDTRQYIMTPGHFRQSEHREQHKGSRKDIN